jgi:1-pyrroline-5-carboxylate dehydrogenase
VQLLAQGLQGLLRDIKTTLCFFRYVRYGDITFKAAEQLRKPEVLDYFAALIQRVSPKSYQQAVGEVTITRQFLDNFGGDQVSWL